ncbi:M60 family metallopeptidase [Dyella acidisoli]|nr:M60 family metallopeptidase [Dyella acidisoli]
MKLPREGAPLAKSRVPAIPAHKHPVQSRARIAALDNPTLHTDILPSRRFTLVQAKLPDKQFMIRQRTFFEFPLTPMRSTGYWVSSGDTLEIEFQYTGSAPSPMPSVWIHSLDEDTWEYDETQRARLRQGINTIRASKKGAVYIAVENQPTGGTMTVNIISGGHPMPRFVLGEHTASDWTSMLQAYGNAPYAELISRRAMITLTLAHARQYVDDPVGMLEDWDRITNFSEAEYGLALDNAPPHDASQLPYHMVECVRCDGFMYAGPYRTAYVDDAIKYAVNRRLLEEDSLRGHELGHVLQHDDLTMDPPNDAESVVELSSQVVQIDLFDMESLLVEERVWPHIQRYLDQSSKNWNDLIFDSERTRLMRFGMFWQLQLAFGPTFYPRYARESRALQGYPGGAKAEKQARVVIETSRVAGRNLIPFYEKWGMPITAATRRTVEDLHLPTLDKPIWENTDMSAPYTYYGPDEELPPVGDIVVPNEVHSGDRFSAVADVSSPGGHALSYRWNHGRFENPQGGNTDTLTVTAPSVQSATPMDVSVDVSDGKQSSTFKAEVLVEPASSGGGCDGVPPWDSSKTYAAYGEQVEDQGKIYHQNFHNTNMPPHLHNGLGTPWLFVRNCAGQ